MSAVQPGTHVVLCAVGSKVRFDQRQCILSELEQLNVSHEMVVILVTLD
jgi:hypothetical protein